jgi:hypothetical protein
MKKKKLIIRDDLPYVSDEEQKEIEEELKNPDYHIVAQEKTITIEI